MKTVENAIATALNGAISGITQRSIYNRLGPLAARPVTQIDDTERSRIMRELETSVRLFARAGSTELIAACARALAQGNGDSPAAGRSFIPTERSFPVTEEKDIATARLEAWSEAVRIGFSKFTSVKVATAVSELARNIVFYAGKGKVELRSVSDGKRARLEIVASDQGPGIDAARLAQIYDGSYRSTRGMGKGLMAVKKLVDEFDLATGPGRGTVVTCVFRGDR
jgi:serine/threonine-protein kinase RsbT